jgi:hypothetical protein
MISEVRYPKVKQNKKLLSLLIILCIVIAGLICQSCEKSGVGNQQQSTSGNLLITLDVNYQASDSIHYSFPNTGITPAQAYIKQVHSTYSSTSLQSGYLRTIIIQSTKQDPIKEDSFHITITVNGSKVQEASGKKILTTSFYY